MWFNRRQYDRLSSVESDAGLDEKDSVQPQSQSIVTLKNVAAISGWALSFVLIFLLGYQDDKLAKRSSCFEQTSAYSPIMHDVPQDYILTRTNGTLDFPSKFRGAPSPALDRTWDEISIFRPLSVDVSDEEYRKFGSSIETAVRNEAKYGGNFFVQPEFSHHLHCVNLLRKASYFNFEYYRTKTFDFRDTPERMIKTHIDHCLEMLRQFVMCNADVGLVASHWVDGIDHPWPDFNTNKKCRDFEGILEWTLEHQAPEGIPQIPKRPEGVKGLATPP